MTEFVTASPVPIPDLIGASPIIRWANTKAEESFKFYLDNGTHPGIAVRGLNSGVLEYKTEDENLWLEFD